MIIYYNMRIDIWNSCLFQTILTTFQYWQFLNQGCFQKVYIIWLSIRLLNDSGTCFSITKMEYISHALWYSLTHSMYEMFNHWRHVLLKIDQLQKENTIKVRSRPANGDNSDLFIVFYVTVIAYKIAILVQCSTIVLCFGGFTVLNGQREIDWGVIYHRGKVIS